MAQSHRRGAGVNDSGAKSVGTAKAVPFFVMAVQRGNPYSPICHCEVSSQTGVGSDLSAASGRYSEVSEWQRSKFRWL